MLKKTIRQARRMAIGVIGISVMLFGFVLLFTPGPAVIVVPIGLGILATEFVWARNLLKSMKPKKGDSKCSKNI